jgi:inositol phosphorylceramide mannosyltransferase catalytic subunit
MMRIPPRVRILLAIATNLAATLWVVAHLLVFKQIFFQHSGIAITQTQVAELFDGEGETRPQLIPKIIHQVFHNWHDPGNDTLPSDWQDVRRTCIDTNLGWEYKVGNTLRHPGPC